MDSFNSENISSSDGNKNSLNPEESYDNELEFASTRMMNDPSETIRSDIRRIIIGPNVEDGEHSQFYMICAENKVNALMEREKTFRESFDGPEEFEDEAVSMAILHHGLRKNDSENTMQLFEDCENLDIARESPPLDNHSLENNSFHLLDNCPTKLKRNDLTRKKEKKRHLKYPRLENSPISREGFDIDDIYFLNEAVAAAIEQKGLCSTSLCDL